MNPNTPINPDGMRDDQEFREMAQWSNSLIPLLNELESIAGHHLPSLLAKRFQKLHSQLFQENHPLLENLKSKDNGKPDWLKTCRSGLLDDLQEGLAACSYHLDAVSRLEGRMVDAATAFLSNVTLPKQPGCIGGGNTRALNSEYQAFAFAARRSLEYLGSGIAAYFKTSCSSIRDLDDILSKAKNREKAEAVALALKANRHRIEGIVPANKSARSLRDRLAHWNAVSAGCFNITHSQSAFGIGLIGGGHSLSLQLPIPGQSSTSGEYQTLTAKLREQFDGIVDFSWSLIDSLDFGNEPSPS